MRPNPRVTGGRRISLVEYEIDNFEDGGEAVTALLPVRHLEGHALLRQGPLGAHDALGDGGLGHEESPRDLLGGEAAQQPQGEGDARLGCEHGVAGGEDQAQQVIADVVVERCVEIRRSHLPACFELQSQLRVLALDQLGAAEPVDGAVLGRSHQPRAGLFGDAVPGPLLERGYQGVLRQLLGKPHIAHDADEAGNEPRPLDPPDCVDGAMCVDGRHGRGSQHQASALAST